MVQSMSDLPLRVRRVGVHRVPGGAGEDVVVVEEPLEIRVEGQTAAITMRTPGDDLDLAFGFLAGEGVVDGPDDVRAMAEVGPNTVDVRLAEGVPPWRARLADRQLYATSSCGICGTASLERIGREGGVIAPWEPEPGVLAALSARLRAAQETFDATGGLHAAAAFDGDGGLEDVREDVGRHNAVDKVIGARLRRDAAWAGRGLVTTSRAGFEIVQKAWMAGVPVVVVVGAPTSLAIDAARRSGIRLVAWLRGERWAVYWPR